MRKLLALALTLASFGFIGFGSASEANAATAAATPQIRVRIEPQRRDRDWNRRYRGRDWNRAWNNGRIYTETRSRYVRYGYSTYRETYVVRYFPNGQTTTTLIRRDRIS